MNHIISRDTNTTNMQLSFYEITCTVRVARTVRSKIDSCVLTDKEQILEEYRER